MAIINQRSDTGEPGVTYFNKLTPDQDELRRLLMRRMSTRHGAEGVALYLLNHTTLDEQVEALKVYRMGDK